MRDYFLIDGHNIVSRAWFARAFSTRPDDPDPEEVAKTAVAMVQRQAALMHIREGRALVVYDGGNTQRQRLWPGYKLDRKPRPESLSTALMLSMPAFNLAQIETTTAPDWEADDTIATYHHLLREYGYAVAIYTSDSDLLQCIDDFTVVIQPISKGKVHTWSRDWFVKDYQFQPRSLPHYKAIKGEKDGDGYPGVSGVGEKTGKGLIGRVGTIDRLYDGIGFVAPEMRSRLQNALVEHESQVRLNLQLATLMQVPGITDRSLRL